MHMKVTHHRLSSYIPREWGDMFMSQCSTLMKFENKTPNPLTVSVCSMTPWELDKALEEIKYKGDIFQDIKKLVKELYNEV